MKDRIATVVVTYNRKELLIKSLESIRKQTLKPDAIYIIDNLSTDGTVEMLLEKKYIPFLPDKQISNDQIIKSSVKSYSDLSGDIIVHYVRKFENDGGAGGFYAGINYAYIDGYDWFWLMDDDGIAHNEQLRELIVKSQEKSIMFANALVCNINKPDELAFGGLNNGNDFITTRNAACATKFINYSINPFNGTLVNRLVISKIGNVKKEMFIWGDETEFTLRAIKFGFIPVTITSAIHLHPVIRAKLVNVIPFYKRYSLHIKQKDRMKYFTRNMGYIHKNFNGKSSTITFAIKYFIYYILRLNFSQLYLFLKYYLKGVRNQYD
jgi:rhamnopyranosyl-N-acetylglucosaminyl-diphospho-decaprenol beta-1,3/1,4-galactofuranosyltransferase